MTKKIKVFNCYNCFECSYFKEKETFKKPSKTIQENIPTIKDFIERYVVTGERLHEDYPLGQLDEAKDDNLDFSPLDTRDTDIEEKLDYIQSLRKNQNYQAETGESDNQSVKSKEKKTVTTTENKEEENKEIVQ